MTQKVATAVKWNRDKRQPFSAEFRQWHPKPRISFKERWLSIFFQIWRPRRSHFRHFLALQTASKNARRLRTIEDLFSMVIPSNMIAVHTIHLACEEHETIWSTVSCIRKQHGSRDKRDQTRTTDHRLSRLPLDHRGYTIYPVSWKVTKSVVPRSDTIRGCPLFGWFKKYFI